QSRSNRGEVPPWDVTGTRCRRVTGACARSRSSRSRATRTTAERSRASDCTDTTEGLRAHGRRLARRDRPGDRTRATGLRNHRASDGGADMDMLIAAVVVVAWLTVLRLI